MAERTTLLVAHRRSTLHLADRIVVLDARPGGRPGHPRRAHGPQRRLPDLAVGARGGAAPRQVGDRIEALAALAARSTATARPPRPGGRRTATAAGGRRPGARRDRHRRAEHRPRASVAAGGGGGGGGWRLNLAPTPELLARVAALAPGAGLSPTVDLAKESRHDRGFNLPRLLSEFRRPLLLGLVLVVLDALASLAGPVLVKTGIDSGVVDRSEARALRGLGHLPGRHPGRPLDEIGETFVTGRAAQRIMLSLRIRIWAQLQRLSLDYYEREMAGRIMTRMTTDVDQFESLIENGLLSALVSIVTFVGVGVALVVINPELGLCTLAVVVPLAIATVIFRRRAARLYDLSRERIAIVNADFQESLSGVRESQAFVHEAETMTALPRPRPRLPGIAGGGPAAGGHLLPVRPVPLGRRRRHRARRRRRTDRQRATSPRAP